MLVAMMQQLLWRSSKNVLFCAKTSTAFQFCKIVTGFQKNRNYFRFFTTVETGNKPITTIESVRIYGAVCEIPHPEKAAKGGEDAFFFLPEHCAFGVADGVGGWNDSGVDPRHYSQGIMRDAGEYVKNKPKENNKALLPKDILSYAYHNTTKFNKIQGSSTVIIATITPCGEKKNADDDVCMNISNIGDSQLLVVRDKSIVFRSKSMQHEFNFPFQIGSVGDDVNCMKLEKFTVKDRDIVVMGTDGLFDNLFDEEILLITNQVSKSTSNSLRINDRMKQLAEALSRRASNIALHEHKKLTPFSKGCIEVGYADEIGGKLDDITTICVQIALK